MLKQTLHLPIFEKCKPQIDPCWGPRWGIFTNLSMANRP
jgi:hypothetical protein